MRKQIYLFLLSALSSCAGLIVQGQEKRASWDDFIYTSSWGYLYADAHTQSDRLGVLATHAAIVVLDSTPSRYQAMVSNGDIGFIDRQPLIRRLFANKYHGEPSEYIYRGKEGLQSPHRYIQVADLRIRSAPSTESKVVGKSSINDMAFFDYWPFDQHAWVYFGDTRQCQPKFVQAKYLGKELSYDDVWQMYQAVEGKDVQQEMLIVGRLREIAWRNNYRQLPETLRLYEEVYKRAGQTHPRVDITQELLLAEQMLSSPDPSVYDKEWSMLDAHYRIRGSKCRDGKISVQQAKQMGLKYADIIPNAPECGWEPVHYFLDTDVVLAFEKFQDEKMAGSVYSMAFAGENAWIVGNEIIDRTYSENDFIRKLGRFIDVDRIVEPHVYRIMVADAGFYQIIFENGRPVLFQCFYYC